MESSSRAILFPLYQPDFPNFQLQQEEVPPLKFELRVLQQHGFFHTLKESELFYGRDALNNSDSFKV